MTSRHASQCHEEIIVQTSWTLFQKASRRGWMRRAWAAITRQPRRLMALSSLGSAPYTQHYGGHQTVEIRKIIGSENRIVDFDDRFNPLRGQSKDRWMSVAGARIQGVPLPPVNLIQVGDRYFVRDGHHRISVARTFGQHFIEAEVTVYQMSGPLPWELAAVQPLPVIQPAPLASHTSQGAGSMA
jgi:hypothetical protein